MFLNQKTNIDLHKYRVLFCLTKFTTRGRISIVAFFTEFWFLFSLQEPCFWPKQLAQEQKWKLRVRAFIWVQYFKIRSRFRGSFNNLFTNVNKSSIQLTVDIFKPLSKHKMISINREYVWALKFLAYHINSWFYEIVYV